MRGKFISSGDPVLSGDRKINGLKDDIVHSEVLI